jgi:hypothetical protein
MALGELTKQLAQQALMSAANKEPAPVQPESTADVMLAQIGAMQRALKDDEEIILLFHSGAERIRVMEIFLPSPQVAVLSGMDAERGFARVISPVESLQLVVKVSKVPPGIKAARVNLVAPKPKDSSAK